jgi:hypothetical protein
MEAWDAKSRGRLLPGILTAVARKYALARRHGLKPAKEML